MNNGCLFITELLLYGNCCTLYELPVQVGNKFVNKIFCKKVYSVKKNLKSHIHKKTLQTLVHELYTHPSFSLYIYINVLSITLVTVSLRLVKYVCHKETDADLWTDLQQCLCLLSNKQ